MLPRLPLHMSLVQIVAESVPLTAGVMTVVPGLVVVMTIDAVQKLGPLGCVSEDRRLERLSGSGSTRDPFPQ